MEVPRKQAVQKDDALRSEDREQKTNDSKIPTPPDDLVKRLLSQSCNPLLIDLTKEELIHLVARLRQTQRLPDSKSGLPQPSGSAIIKPRQSMFERGDASIVKETKTITPNNEPAKRIFRNTFLVVWLLSGFALFHYADSFSTDCMIATLLSVFITPFLATLIHKSRSKQS